MTPAHDIPDLNVVEFSLFGPMFGECIVVHYGDGKWLTIDSCLEEDTGAPSALAYLGEIGVSPKAVTHCVVTHADGDHIGGIGRLFEACDQAELVCSTVMSSKEMSTFLAYYAKTNPPMLAGSLRELLAAIKLAFKRPPNTPRYVKEDALIVKSPHMTITALSPSNVKIGQFLKSVITPASGALPKGPALPNPNAVSVAMLFEWDDRTAVMGADLDEKQDKGWSQLMNSSVSFKAAKPASLFKVAHHGSPGADHEPFWKWMGSGLAMLSPFNRGKRRLPHRDDVARILAYTRAAFSSGTYSGAGPKTIAIFDKALYQLGVTRVGLFAKNGHVRVRFYPDGSHEVALFGSAVHLSDAH